MTDDEVYERVIRILAEGGYQTLAGFVRDLDVDILRGMWGWYEEEDDE